MRLFVANIPFKVEENRLREEFSRYGKVVDCRIVKDRNTGLSRGFGFVELARNEDGVKAIENMDGAEMDGRVIRVNEARPRPN